MHTLPDASGFKIIEYSSRLSFVDVVLDEAEMFMPWNLAAKDDDMECTRVRALSFYSRPVYFEL